MSLFKVKDKIMQRNEYILFNGGSPIELSFSFFEKMIKSEQFKIPTFEEIVRFDNNFSFLSDIIYVSCTGIITVNYGNSLEVLNSHDVSHDQYNSFRHKKYPIIVNDHILLSNGNIDVFLMEPGSDNGTSRFGSNIPGKHKDIRHVQIIRPDELHKFVRILSQKEHRLGSITPPHLSQFNESELDTIKQVGIDYAHSMFLAWDANENEIEKAAKFQDEFEKSGGEVYKNPTWANAALTGKFTVYDLEIDCSKLKIDQSSTIFFQDIFSARVCLENDCPDYISDNSDYWVDSVVMGDLIEEELDIRTSLLLTNAQPDKAGKIRITVVDKLINDVRADHGWQI